MKIAFINNFYNSGGGARLSYELAKGLGMNNEMRFYGCVNGEYRSKFAKIGPAFLFPFNIDLSYGNELIKELHIFNPDIVHVFTPGKESLLFLKNLPQKAKKIVTILNDNIIGFDTSIVDQVIFISQYQKNINKHIENSSVVRPAISFESCRSNQKEIPTFGRISPFCPTKKIQDTISCAKLINNQFCIAGEIQKSEISSNYHRGIVAYSRNANNVSITVNINENQKQYLLEKIDVLHYPTTKEAFCFSILEGFAAKKPVLTYKNSALLEIMGDSEWACSDLSELKEKTIKMSTLSSYERQSIGEKNHHLYNEYKTDIHQQQIINVYKKVLTNIEAPMLNT